MKVSENTVCMLRAINMPFYAVKSGRQVGIFKTWAECEQQIKGFKGAKYKKFNSESEASDFVGVQSVPNENVDPIPMRPQPSKSLLKSLKPSRAVIGSDLSTLPATTVNKEILGLCDVATQTLVNSFVEEKRIKAFELSISLLKQQIAEMGEQLKKNSTEIGARRKGENDDGNFKKRLKVAEATSPKIGELNDKVHVYTDGACTNNGKCGAVAGIGIYWGPDHQFNTSERLTGRQTNNRAEIQAAVVALKQAKKQDLKNIVLYTDSQFLINGITKWINGWKKNGWLLTSGEKVKNKADFEALDKARQGLNVDWKYVRGHKGIEGNEMADKLAVQGLSKPLP